VHGWRRLGAEGREGPEYILDGVSDHEVLDVGEDRRPGMSWRVRLALSVGVLAVAAGALVVDRELREREERAVGRCAAQVAEAVDMAGRPVRAAYEYVRPSLVNPSPELQASVRRLIAHTATGADDQLAGPRETCTGVAVLPLHADLQARRDLCLEVLEAQRAGLVAVADDGGNLLEWSRVPRTC
jgi:hypothetical protein